jgi:hypothetical protein
MSKLKFLLLISLLVITLPEVSADEDCGLDNLAVCIPQKMVEFVVSIFNAPADFLLDSIKDYLTEPVEIEHFRGLWQIMVYILSIFYGLFLLFAGYQFVISGSDVVKREMAKDWLKNIIFMMVFVQGSYILYKLLLAMGAGLSEGIMSLINNSFFQITGDSLSELGLQFILSFFYINTLVFTLIMLFMRYLLVSLGIVVFPLGLFLYFIPPLRGYGKLIIEVGLILILLPFFQGLILLIGSMLVQLPLFDELKIIVMIGSFSLVNLAMLFLIAFVGIKAITYVGGVSGSVKAAMKYIGA